MIPESFDYQRASSVSEAISLLQQHGEDAKIVAGGHSLVPTMKLRLATPGTLIDIGGISELKYINDKGDYLAIGAGATHWMIESSDLIQKKAPGLSQAAAQVGDVQVRNRGTIGGVLAHSDPQADYPGVVLALDATLVVQGSRGERTIAVSDYFTGLWETALGDDELLTEVRIPTDSANANSCYLKFPQPASRYPYVGCQMTNGQSERATGSIIIYGARVATYQNTCARMEFQMVKPDGQIGTEDGGMKISGGEVIGGLRLSPWSGNWTEVSAQIYGLNT